MNKLETLQGVLNGLMCRYQTRVLDVGNIIQAMVQEGIISRPEDIENDHIAFRTLGVPQLGIQSLEKIFLFYGYQKRDSYYFREKKLNACWYSPPTSEFPRIFISELRIGALLEEAQRIIYSYTNEVRTDPVDDLNLESITDVDTFLHKALWRLPSYTDYANLQRESEYAAWVIYNRYYLNHFTISVHNLPEGYNTLEQFNGFLEKSGFQLNTSGGKIKKSGDGLLLQSSTVAEIIDAEFAGSEIHAISGSYVEFAERQVLPQYRSLPVSEIKREHRREGFEVDNADKIFESTYSSQTICRTSMACHSNASDEKGHV